MTALFPPPSPPPVGIDENTVCDWLADSMPGAALIYYRGHLGHDRMPSTKVLPEHLRRQVADVASRIRLAAEDGRVFLLQQRHGANDFSYLAIKATGDSKRRSRR